MATQNTAYPEVNAPPGRLTTSDDRSVAETIAAAAPELKSRLQHVVEAGKARASQWKGGLQDGIRERPIQSVLIAVAVGAVIGLLVGRRSH